MYDAILVPTDGSAHARRAVRRAGELARTFDADLHLLAVVDVQEAAGPFSAGGVDEEYVDRLRERGYETARSASEPVEDLTGVRTDARTGTPSEEILAYVDERGIDLVVMGTRGLTGARGVALGSVTERVVRNAPVPVLTTTAEDRPDPEEGYRDVLVATDGSDAALAALEHALAVAGRYDARVHALYVIDVGDAGTYPEYSPSAELRSALASRGEAATGVVADRANEAGLDAVTEVSTGRPTGRILDYAEEKEIGLIAMGTTGRSGLGERILGSTTERVLRRATAPVLAVGASEDAE